MESVRSIGVCLVFFFLILFSGCDKEKDYSGLFQARIDADERFNQSLEPVRQRFPSEIFVEANSYKVIFAADCHVGGTKNLEKLLQHSKFTETTALFLAGDITTGKAEDYEIAERVLDTTDSVRLYCVVGNHDLFFEGWKSFYNYFGSSTYIVVIKTPQGSDLFICLDTGGGTVGDLQLDWLKKVLGTQRYLYRNCIVVTHDNFFRKHITESTNPLVEEIEILMEQFYINQVNFVIMGHDHTRDEDVFGVTTYLTLDGISDDTDNPSYLELNVNDGILEYHFREL